MSEQTRVDLSLIGVDATTQKGMRPYWDGRQFTMRDPKSQNEVPEAGKDTVTYDTPGVVDVDVPDGATMVEISLAGGAGGGGSGGVYGKTQHYEGSSGGGGGSSAVVEIDTSKVLSEAGGGAGGNGGNGQSHQDGGKGGRGAVVGRHMAKVKPGYKLRLVVGAGGVGGKHWGTPLGANGGTNKGGEGGEGYTKGTKGDDGSLPGFPRAGGAGGGEYAGPSRGQSLKAYNGVDGQQVGDTRGLVPSNGGAGGAGASEGTPTCDGADGGSGFIRLTWMTMPAMGVVQYAKYVAKNGSVVEVCYSPIYERYYYRLSGYADFKMYTGVPTEYSEPTYGQAWRPEGEKVKIKSITNIDSDVWTAVRHPDVLGPAEDAIGLAKTAGMRIIVVGWDAFYQDRFEWVVDYLNSDFEVK